LADPHFPQNFWASLNGDPHVPQNLLIVFSPLRPRPANYRRPGIRTFGTTPVRTLALDCHCCDALSHRGEAEHASYEIRGNSQISHKDLSFGPYKGGGPKLRGNDRER
jgi:hypothetical protein